MGAVGLAGPFAGPEQVGRAVVPVAGEAVLAGQGLLPTEQQRFVRRPEVDLVQRRLPAEVDAAGGHEPQGPVDLAGDHFVGQAFGAGGDELLVPGVGLGQVGEPALGEGPQQVQRRRRLVVGVDQPVGVGLAGLGREPGVVHDVAPERRQLHAVAHLGGRRPRLGELAGDPADLHHRDAGAVGHDHGHLEDHPELVADGVGGEVERLGAVTGLEEHRPPFGHAGQRGRQRPGLAGEDEWREAAEPVEGALQCSRVGPLRLLGGGAGPPRAGRPRCLVGAGEIEVVQTGLRSGGGYR